MNKIKKGLVEGKLLARVNIIIKKGIVKGFHGIINFPGDVVKRLDNSMAESYRKKWAKKVPVNDKKIMFMTFNNKYNCNPKYIAQKMHELHPEFELVWVVGAKDKNAHVKFPPYIKTVNRGTYEAFYEMASSKFWVDNAISFFYFDNVPKKDNQVYINTWHGSLGFKKIGKDDVPNERWKNAAIECTANTTFCISNSDFETDVFRETHWPNGDIKMLGHARNDILIDTDPAFVRKMKKELARKYNFNPDAKICMYAPTFRDSMRVDCYDVDFTELKSALEEKFGGEWVIFRRLHFKNRSAKLPIPASEKEFVKDATAYDDMQELLCVTDIGLSDYSSWLCDFMLTRKPAFIFATDIEEFEGGRGLYYPLETTPFPIATNNEELVEAVLKFDNEKYIKGVDEFLKDKGCVDDGKSAQRIVEEICRWSDGENK